MELGRAGVCLERSRYLSKQRANVSGIAALAGLGARCECVTTACNYANKQTKIAIRCVVLVPRDLPLTSYTSKHDARSGY